MNGSLKKSTIEKVKDLVLVVLFLLTVLLLCFFWADISFKDISLDDFPFMEETTETEALEISKVLIPSEMILSHGEGAYTKITENKKRIWDNSTGDGNGMMQCFAEFMQGENILLEEITKEQYDSVTKFLSLRASFSFYVPFTEFCQYRGITLPSGGNDIDAMTELAISVGSLESFFIYDGSGKKYYRMAAEQPNELVDRFLKELDVSESEPYYPARVVLGNPIENEELIPIYTETDLRDFSYKNELNVTDSETVTRIAREFFGDSFDFIRKIEEAGGATIYMYGYGEKVLIADIDGSVEYKSEPSDTNGKTTYFEALDKALSFITKHGGVYTLGGNKLDLFLKNLNKPQEKNQIYRFEFGISEGGTEINYQDAFPLAVEVTGGQVSYYKRMLPEYETSAVSDSHEAFQVVNVLAQNYEYIYSVLSEAGVATQADKGQTEFNLVSEQISNISYGYIRMPDAHEENEETYITGGEIKAAWIIAFSDGAIETYFGLQDAEPLGYCIIK